MNVNLYLITESSSYNSNGTFNINQSTVINIPILDGEDEDEAINKTIWDLKEGRFASGWDCDCEEGCDSTCDAFNEAVEKRLYVGILKYDPTKLSHEMRPGCEGLRDTTKATAARKLLVIEELQREILIEEERIEKLHNSIYVAETKLIMMRKLLNQNQNQNQDL